MITLLHGHTSPETAFLVADYPYGFRLRCKIRYWIETATKGEKKGQQRFMSQTTNPKIPGEHWNKPKGSTYSHIAVMYLDENGHVQNDGLIPSGPDAFTRFAVYQLDEEQAKRLKVLEILSRRWSPISWAEHDAQKPDPPVSNQTP